MLLDELPGGLRSALQKLVPAGLLKQQLQADGSVFLISLLQLWMVHSNQAVWHPPANAAYHTAAAEGGAKSEEEEEGEEERMGEEKGR